MKTINHESDFKLLVGYSDGSPINEPFRFTFYTKVSRGTFIAEYNGSEYVKLLPRWWHGQDTLRQAYARYGCAECEDRALPQ